MSVDRKTILVCGDGLAGRLSATALSGALGKAYRIVLVGARTAPAEDLFYGTVTAPSGYDFLLSLGLTEPALFMETETSFSYGTHYKTWPGQKPWVQSHQAPFQNIAGTPLRHHLTRTNIAMAPLLVAAQSALQGRFAHPPEDPKVPLSRAEYGYQFNPSEWVDLLGRQLAKTSVEIADAKISHIAHDGEQITGIELGDGMRFSPDLVIDCTGSHRACLKTLDARFDSQRRIAAWGQRRGTGQLGAPCRSIESGPDGWTSTTHLQNSDYVLSIGDPEQSGRGEPDATLALGRVQNAWIGNCVAIGHAASALEPITPAPMMLLQRDIERLLELIPVSQDMTAERREFNRRFQDDVTHSELFQLALYCGNALPSTAYWRAAKAASDTETLKRKVAQFEHRGLLVKYDLEPFNDEDWTILHFGMGRVPRLHDLQAELMPMNEVATELAAMKQAIEQMVPRMPPHHVYVGNMKRYFEKQKYV